MSFDDEIMKTGFDMDKYIEECAKRNRKKYPPEFYQMSIKLLSKGLTDEFMKLVKKYDYKPYG